MAQLVLQLLGSFAVRDGSGVDIRIASRKGRALLAFLGARPGEAHSRDRLACLLWEDADEELGRTSLRQALAAIRKALPASTHGALIADTDSLRLDPALIETDVSALRDAIKAGTRAALMDVLDRHRGEFLEGVDARSTAFDAWVTQERLGLRRQFADALQTLSALCTAHDDIEGALAASSRLVSIEPLNEAAHRTVMELQGRRHAYADALRQYQICRDVLRRELDVAPEPATEALYRDLMRRRRAATSVITAEDSQSDDRAPEGTPAPRIERRTELRDAVVLVVRLEGLLELEARLEPEEGYAMGREFHERVASLIDRFGGCTDRRAGSTILAVFGATAMRGNEAEQALKASLALRQEIAAKRWSLPSGTALRIGVAQGQLLVGAEIFPLNGRPVHAAHSLAARAGDEEICIAASIRNSLAACIAADRLPTTTAESESAWLLQSMHADHRAPAVPLVGRRPELAMLMAMLERSRTSRHGRAVVVRGEAGIGKSRLIREVTAAARDTGVAVHFSSAFDFGQSPGQRPLTTLALSLLGLSAEAAPEERVAAVTQSLGDRSTIDQIIFLSDLVDAPLNSELAALENAMDTTTRQRGRSLALAHLLESAAQRQPLLLVIEDVHWTDQDELARFGEIAAVIAHCPALLIMTTRPEGDPIGSLWRARARGCPVTTVDLAPLADDEAQALARHYTNLSDEVIAACITRAEGNPLFLDQLLRAAFDGHDCLPGSVRALVLARAERLSSTDRDALQAASVLGQRFSIDALRRLIDDADYAPSALTETALMRGEDDDFEFAHALFRDAIYESTLRSRRRDLHRRAAAGFASQDLALHADHLAAAEDPEAAAAYLAAARSEQACSRFERALMLANKANVIAHDPMQLHHAQCLLGELLLTLGRTHDALTAYREAIDFSPDQRRQVDAWVGVASALRVMDRHLEALDALDRAEKALGGADDIRIKIRISTLRGNLCFPLGRIDDCLREHERAMKLASAANSPVDLARAYSGLGDAWYQRGRMRTASDYFARCIEAARHHNLPAVRIANLPMLGLTRLYCGDASITDQCLKEALELSRHLCDARSELLTELVTASTMLMRGELDLGEKYAQRARDLAEQLGARRFHAEAVCLQACCRLARNQRSAADELVREGLELGRVTGMHYCGPVLLGVLARTTTLPEERRQALREGEELLAAGCVSHSYFEFYFHAVEVSLREGQWAEARRYADALAAYTRDEPLVWTDLLIERAHCLASIGSGDLSPRIANSLRDVRTRCNALDLKLPLGGIEEGLHRLAAVQA